MILITIMVLHTRSNKDFLINIFSKNNISETVSKNYDEDDQKEEEEIQEVEDKEAELWHHRNN